MTSSWLRVCAALTLESLLDAVRRRIAFVILALGVLSMLFIDSCTACSPRLRLDDEAVPLSALAGVAGTILVVSLGLWLQVLAGVLASDHLAEPLSDGSAHLILARPVSRSVFAVSRLAGVLLLVAGAGALLMAVSGALLQARQGLPAAPLLGAFAACLVGALTVSAAAMALSLFLPRVAIALLAFAAVWGIAWIEVLGRFGPELSGFVGALHRFGPPLASGMLASLSSWLDGVPLAPEAEPAGPLLRAVVWAGLALGALAEAFRRHELR